MMIEIMEHFNYSNNIAHFMILTKYILILMLTDNLIAIPIIMMTKNEKETLQYYFFSKHHEIIDSTDNRYTIILYDYI